jgi:predicted  nucleic acid-binding Zn-ribbon protein
MRNQVEANDAINEYLRLKSSKQKTEARLDELEAHIRDYMEKEGLTRVFGDEGYLSRKTRQSYGYDLEKVKALLSPLGKWEEILSVSAEKLKKILYEVPEDVRLAVEELRTVAKEYAVLTASLESIKKPEDAAADSL